MLTPDQVSQFRSSYGLDNIKGLPPVSNSVPTPQTQNALPSATPTTTPTNEPALPPENNTQLPNWYTQLRNPQTPAPKPQQNTPQPGQDQVPSGPSGWDMIKSAFKGGINQVKQGVQDVGASHNPVTFAEGALNAGAGVVNTALSPIAPFFKPVGDALNAATQPIANNPSVQNFANSKAGQITSRVAGDVGNLDTIAGAVASEKLLPPATDMLDSATAGLNAAKDSARNVISKTIGKDAQAADEASIAQQTANNAKTATGKIVQGTPEDVVPAQSALSNIDTSKVKTYQDLSSTIDNKIKQVSDLQSQAMDASHPSPVHAADLTYKGHNYVQDAVSQLMDYYTKTNDIDGINKIKALQTQLDTQGLTPKQVNDLARLHGSELNGYNANGELASGLSKQAAENTRQGLKGTSRNLLGDTAFQASDKELTDLLNTKDLVDNMSKQVNKLQQKIQQRGILSKVGYGAAKISDLMTGGGLKGFLSYFIPRGEGLKTLNAIDLQNMLQKNLTAVTKLNGTNVSDSALISYLNDIIKNGPKQKALPTLPNK